MTLLPVPADTSTSLYVELEIYDVELDRSVIASKVVDLSSVGDGGSETTAGEDIKGSGAMAVVAGLGMLLLLVGTGAVLVGRSRKAASESTEMVSEEPPASSGTGLLARAKQLK